MWNLASEVASDTIGPLGETSNYPTIDMNKKWINYSFPRNNSRFTQYTDANALVLSFDNIVFAEDALGTPDSIQSLPTNTEASWAIPTNTTTNASSWNYLITPTLHIFSSKNME